MYRPRKRPSAEVLEARVARVMEALDEAGEAEPNQVEFLGRIRDEVSIRLEGAIMEAGEEATDVD